MGHVNIVGSVKCTCCEFFVLLLLLSLIIPCKVVAATAAIGSFGWSRTASKNSSSSLCIIGERPGLTPKGCLNSPTAKAACRCLESFHSPLHRLLQWPLPLLRVLALPSLALSPLPSPLLLLLIPLWQGLHVIGYSAAFWHSACEERGMHLHVGNFLYLPILCMLECVLLYTFCPWCIHLGHAACRLAY